MFESVPLLAVVLALAAILVILALRSEPRAPKPPRPWERPPATPPVAPHPLGSATAQARPAEPPQPGTGGAGDAGPILITHPLVRRAAEKALADPAAAPQYIVRMGDQIYLVLDGIEDPEERRRAHEILSQFQDGGETVEGSLPEFLRLIRRLTGGS